MLTQFELPLWFTSTTLSHSCALPVLSGKVARKTKSRVRLRDGVRFRDRDRDRVLISSEVYRDKVRFSSCSGLGKGQGLG